MKPFVFLVCLVPLLPCGCSWLPGTGPFASEVVEQGQRAGDVLFDIVDVDDRVVSTVLAQPRESFAVRFKKDAEPPEIPIAVGDTVSVLIWESASGGLFSNAPPELGSRTGIEPLAPESPPAAGEANAPRATRRPSGTPPPESVPIEPAAGTDGRQAVIIPDQQVGADAAISVPYAGRIPAAGRSPAEVQQTIEARLAEKALGPQALVIVRKSSANAVTVTGEAVSGAKVPLSPGGDRLLQVIGSAGAAIPLSPGSDRLPQTSASAGALNVPVHEIFVRLSRGGVTATIPMKTLVSEPAEDIFAQPGDVLTLVRIPQTFTVFGAAGRNDDIVFDAERITLSEALGKSQGLRDDLANPKGVFLFRYEPNSTVRALDQPVAARSFNDSSPIAYRFDFKDANSYLLAQRFPVRDKDIIFVADAGAVQVQKLFTLLSTVTGPIVTGLLVCRHTTC
jgi:polysaccharide biosynthesis/export protein